MSERRFWIRADVDCRGGVHQLLPTTQGNATDYDIPLPAVIMVQGIDHPIQASALGNYYRCDSCAYCHKHKSSAWMFASTAGFLLCGIPRSLVVWNLLADHLQAFGSALTNPEPQH